MIAFPDTIDRLIDALQQFRMVCGGGVPIGTPWRDAVPGSADGIDDLVQVELVAIDKAGRVVGTEATGHQLQPGEQWALRLS